MHAKLVLMSVVSIFVSIIMLGVLIVIHEGGHYLVARLSGMRVDRFSIGFGPSLVQFKRGETTYQVSAIPLGGYVQIAGLNPGDENISTDDERSYPNRPVYQRLATIFAGPGTNYLFAALMMALINAVWGVPAPGKMPIVSQVVQDKPAATAGIQPGDEIVTIDGQTIKDATEVTGIINGRKGAPVAVVVLRETRPRTFTIQPYRDPAEGTWRIGIGVDRVQIRERQPIGQALVAGLIWPYDQTVFALHGFADMFRGKQKAEFSGPIGIVSVMKGQIAKGLDWALSTMAIISVYLGLFNLLPLPALDGGRLAFLAYEGLSRRRVNQRIEQMVHMVGLFVLLGFLLYVSAGDIRKLLHH
jgi:regulator of sigma E protease